MDAKELIRRTNAFALRVIRLIDALPKERVTDTLARQLLRSATSVGANYRAAARARSRSDFVAKLKIVEEECDESVFWLELLVASGRVKPQQMSALIKEANELLAIVVASIKTARTRETAVQSSIVNRQS